MYRSIAGARKRHDQEPITALALLRPGVRISDSSDASGLAPVMAEWLLIPKRGDPATPLLISITCSYLSDEGVVAHSQARGSSYASPGIHHSKG